MKIIKWKNKQYFNKINNYDNYGRIIRKNNKNINHPVIIFFTNDYVYYLNARSAIDKNTNKFKNHQIGEMALQFNLKGKGKEWSYVNLTSIMIMPIEDFFKVYKSSDILNIRSNLNNKQAKIFYEKLFSRLNLDEKITIQDVWIENRMMKNEVIYTNIKKLLKSNVENTVEGIAQKEYIQNNCECINTLNWKSFKKFNKHYSNTNYLAKKSKEYIPLNDFRDYFWKQNNKNTLKR